MPHKAVAIVAAMPIELAPIISGLEVQRVNGVDLFELPNALIAIGGIGKKYARRAAEVAVEWAQPQRLISVGMVGALAPELRVGDVGQVREVVDVATGVRYSAMGGEWILATSQGVSDAAEKQQFRARHGADVVDMEAAAVAQVARERGLEFASVKVISDDAAFTMPPMDRFINANGRFQTIRFAMHVVVRPKWWSLLGTLKKNSDLAAKNLCSTLEHLLEERGQGSGIRV
jgi:adenosylhomocysteine nucleosidase